jgi:hypothetical protein
VRVTAGSDGPSDGPGTGGTGNGQDGNSQDGWHRQEGYEQGGQDGNGHGGNGQGSDSQDGWYGSPGGLPVAGRVRLADGSPASGAAVTLIDATGRQAGRSSAGADGSFHIAAPASGLYTLIAMAAAHQPQASTVRVGDGPVQHDVTLAGTSRLAGTARTAAGEVIEDARVALLDPAGNVATVTTTGPDGGYSFENLPPGEYTVVASGYPPVAQSVRIAPGQPHSHDPVLGHPEA